MKKHEKLNYNSQTFFNMESKGMPVRVLLLNIQSFHISDFFSAQDMHTTSTASRTAWHASNHIS
jgi:hypothetical protein